MGHLIAPNTQFWPILDCPSFCLHSSLGSNPPFSSWPLPAGTQALLCNTDTPLRAVSYFLQKHSLSQFFSPEPSAPRQLSQVNTWNVFSPSTRLGVSRTFENPLPRLTACVMCHVPVLEITLCQCLSPASLSLCPLPPTLPPSHPSIHRPFTHHLLIHPLT